MKDSYWLAANYGVVAEAKRDNLNLQMYQAGGYTNLSTQLNQMDNCIAQGFDAIVLGAISADGVGSLVDKAVDKGIPVIDFVNGVNSPKVSAHALVSFHDLAVTTAKFIIESSGGKPVNVGYFPGPQGAGWSDDAVRGFEETIKGSNVKISVTRRGDTGENIQLAMIQNALQAYPDINYLVGVDIAAQAAAVAVRNMHLEGKIKVMAFDIIPPVYQDIEEGATVGSPTDFTVIQGRMAVDMAVRLLEKQTLDGEAFGPDPKNGHQGQYQVHSLDRHVCAEGFSRDLHSHGAVTLEPSCSDGLSGGHRATKRDRGLAPRRFEIVRKRRRAQGCVARYPQRRGSYPTG